MSLIDARLARDTTAAERPAEIPIGYGVTLGWRLIDGLPALGLEPFAMVFLRFEGRCFWSWDEGIGGRS